MASGFEISKFYRNPKFSSVILQKAFDVFESGIVDTHSDYLKPEVTLLGVRSGGRTVRRWKAMLNVNKFLMTAADAASLDWRPLTNEEKKFGRLMRLVAEGKRQASRGRAASEPR